MLGGAGTATGVEGVEEEEEVEVGEGEELEAWRLKEDAGEDPKGVAGAEAGLEGNRGIVGVLGADPV